MPLNVSLKYKLKLRGKKKNHLDTMAILFNYFTPKKKNLLGSIQKELISYRWYKEYHRSTSFCVSIQSVMSLTI